MPQMRFGFTNLDVLTASIVSYSIFIRFSLVLQKLKKNFSLSPPPTDILISLSGFAGKVSQPTNLLFLFKYYPAVASGRAQPCVTYSKELFVSVSMFKIAEPL